MVTKRAKNMTNAKMTAARARKRGLNASIFKTKGGKIKISVTRRK